MSAEPESPRETDMDLEKLRHDYAQALNRLCKWRTVFAGWQLGTRANSDPEAQAVRDHRDATMVLRAEVSGITALLVKKGIISEAEYLTQMIEEADALSRVYEEVFPGFKATDEGMHMDLVKAAETMKHWKS